MIKHSIVATAAVTLAACTGLQAETVDLPHGYSYTQVSDDRHLTVSRAGYLFDADGGFIDATAYTGPHPATGIARSMIQAGGMVGAARALRPSQTDVEGGSGGAASATGGEASATGGAANATSASQADAAASSTNINVNTATGGSGGDFCPPGQPAPHC